MEPTTGKAKSSKLDPKVAELLAASAALGAAFERVLRALQAIYGPAEGEEDLLARAAYNGLVLTLARSPWAIRQVDLRSLAVATDGDLEDAIVDAMADLAALARVSGLDEQALFDRRLIYEEFAEAMAPDQAAE